MSRIDDSDNQRIREMQEQELRARKDGEKKDTDTRTTKSFQEVMRERTQKQTAQKTSAQEQHKGKAQEKAQTEQESFAQQLLKRLPKEGADLQKRAAMSRAMASNMASSRTQDAQKAREAETDRVDDLVKKADDDRDRIEKAEREEGERETKRTEERDAKFHKIEAEPEDRGGQKEKNPRQRHDSGKGERKTEGAAAVKETKQEAAPRGIPPEVIEKLVSAIHHAVHADGRTEMQVELKGSMLEGVRLKVRADRGKVSCTFEGADKELKNLLESSKGALMRSLEKRGLTLTSLKVV